MQNIIPRSLNAVFFRRKPVHLILHVTQKCNLKCKTCFVDFAKNANQKDITLAEIRSLSSYLKKIIWLDLSGGEPFLRKDLVQICTSFNTTSLSIPTNGFDPELIYSTTKEIQKKISCPLTISVSIDGFEKTNDEIRNKGGFKQALRTIKLLKKIKGIQIKVNTVLCKKNYNEIPEFMEFIKKLDLDFHSIIFLRGKPRDPAYRCPSSKELQRIKKKIFKIWETYNLGQSGLSVRLLRNYQQAMYNASVKVIKEKKQFPTCLAHKSHLVVYPNTNVSFCEILPSIGNLRLDGGIENILKSPKAVKQRKMIKQKKCYCHHNCNLVDNFFLNPKHYPKIIGTPLWKK
jgi:MoaA/NifB/PqqE/SkfB family radical SAM enzyme